MTENKKTRKMDRRTIYTQNVIKDSLLELLETCSFENLTVTAVCKQAEITRATFYLHYDNLTDVLNETLDDALRLANHEPHNVNADMQQMLDIMMHQDDPEILHQYDTLLPACQRIADIPKYHALFLDESLSAYIIKKIYQTEKNHMVPELMKLCHLSAKEAEKVFMFTVYGAYQVNKSMNWEKNKEWYQLQKSLIKFILGGFRALS